MSNWGEITLISGVLGPYITGRCQAVTSWAAQGLRHLAARRRSGASGAFRGAAASQGASKTDGVGSIRTFWCCWPLAKRKLWNAILGKTGKTLSNIQQIVYTNFRKSPRIQHIRGVPPPVTHTIPVKFTLRNRMKPVSVLVFCAYIYIIYIYSL